LLGNCSRQAEEELGAGVRIGAALHDAAGAAGDVVAVVGSEPAGCGLAAAESKTNAPTARKKRERAPAWV